MTHYSFDAELVKVADAVTDELRKLESIHVGRIYPERTYGEFADSLEELEELRVDVLPVDYTETSANTRESIGYVCAVDIAVRKKIGPVDRYPSGRLRRRAIDRLIGLVQEIHEFLFNRRLTKYEEAAFESLDLLQGYSWERLSNDQLFWGAVRVKYRVSKEVTTAR